MKKPHNPPDLMPPIGPLSWGIETPQAKRLLFVCAIHRDDAVREQVREWRIGPPAASFAIRYCLGMPARSITAAHFLISPSSRAFNCSGVLALASIPRSA